MVSCWLFCQRTMNERKPVNWYREPLLHFIVIGFLIFLIFDLLPGEVSDDARIIRAGDSQLLTLIRSRNPRFSLEAASSYLSSLTSDERERLVQDFIREEVMYREAVALGLDKNDYNNRRRLINQLEYINRGFIQESLSISNDELVHYHSGNRERYFVSPQITFTHVYFSSERNGEDNARSMADQELRILNEKEVPFHRAGFHGDRFLYHRNYVNKEQEEIASHFGKEFGRIVFELSKDDEWQGPFGSAYGYHLLLVNSVKSGYYPPLEEVSTRVVDDVVQIRIREELDQIYQQVRDSYDILIEEPRISSR